MDERLNRCQWSSRKVGVLVSPRARLPSNAVAGFPRDSLASRRSAFVVPSPSTYEKGHSFAFRRSPPSGVSVSASCAIIVTVASR